MHDGVAQLLRSSQGAWLVDRNFTFNGQQSSVARAHFAFGAPLAGFNSKRDRKSDQIKILRSFIRDELFPYLTKASSSEMRVMWYNEEASTYEVINAAIHDAKIAGSALLFVVLAMWRHSRSFLMAMLSSLSMLYALPLAYCVVVVVLDFRTMSIFNVVSLFILAGIGADDLFVFVDIWKQSAVKFPALSITSGRQGKSRCLHGQGFCFTRATFDQSTAKPTEPTQSHPVDVVLYISGSQV
jgi:hypothetical protein